MNDLRYALRQLRKNPLFTLIAVLTLALGIGIDTAIFSAAKETLRPSLPFRESERLVRIYQVPEGSSVRVSPRVPAFMAVRDGAESLESVVGSRFSNFTLHTPDGPERLVGNAVTRPWAATSRRTKRQPEREAASSWSATRCGRRGWGAPRMRWDPRSG